MTLYCGFVMRAGVRTRDTRRPSRALFDIGEGGGRADGSEGGNDHPDHQRLSRDRQHAAGCGFEHAHGGSPMPEEYPASAIW
jgi:hypothetical protein